jgi:hypothetical protein
MQRIESSQRNRIDPEQETFRFAVYRWVQFQPIERPGIRVLENCIANLAGLINVEYALSLSAGDRR